MGAASCSFTPTPMTRPSHRDDDRPVRGDPGCGHRWSRAPWASRATSSDRSSRTLGADRGDRLGEHRLTELRAALDALGVDRFAVARRPGQVSRLRDDGHRRRTTAWTASGARICLQAASELVAVIRDVRPQVLVTYDDDGGYGHPDHIQAHRVTMYAFLLAGVASFRPDLGEPYLVSKVYWTVFPRCVSDIDALRGLVQAHRHDRRGSCGWCPPSPLTKAWVTTAIDGGPLYPGQTRGAACPCLGDRLWRRLLRGERPGPLRGLGHGVLPARPRLRRRTLRR